MARIFVYLKQEGTDAWRPVDAEELSDNVYRITSKNQNPKDETWEYNFGEIVQCKKKTFSDGSVGLVAAKPHSLSLNKGIILLHLEDAKDEIAKICDNIKNNPNYDFVEYSISFAHLYNHLNTAWNIRYELLETVEESNEDNFYKWRSFPKDINLGK